MKAQGVAKPVVATGVVYLLAGSAVVGPDVAIVAAIVVVLFSLPGLLYFRAAGSAMIVPACVVGIASTTLATALAGSLLGYFGWALVLITASVLAVIAWLRPARMEVASAEIRDDARTRLFFHLSAWVAVGIVLVPFLGVGSPGDGSYRYTAFFNADFFKHMAHVSSIVDGALPPLDHFGAGETLHYYWLGYLMPASVVAFIGDVGSVGRALLAITLLQSGLVATGLFLAIRRAGAPAPLAWAITTVGLLSPSLDGVTSLVTHWDSPAHAMRVVNQEALDFTSVLGAPYSIASSTLFRLCLYIPQHQLAILLLVAWFLLFARADETRGASVIRAILVLPLPAISLATGGIAAAAILLAEITRAGNRARSTLLFGSAFGAAWLICIGLQIITIDWNEMTSDPLLRPVARGAPVGMRLAWAPLQMVTSFGAPVLFGLAGALVATSRRGAGLARGAEAALIISGVGIATLLASELLPRGSLTLETQLKTSFVTGIGLAIGTGYFFSGNLPRFRGFAIWRGLGVAILLPGLIAPLHDLVWHSTFSANTTVVIPEEEMEALRWVRSTPAETVFQQYPEPPFLLGGRDTWIPVFGGRAVRISWRRKALHRRELAAAHLLFQPELSDEDRLLIAADLNIDAVYVSRALQPGAYADLNAAMARLGWRKWFQNSGVTVWATNASAAAPAAATGELE